MIIFLLLSFTSEPEFNFTINFLKILVAYKEKKKQMCMSLYLHVSGLKLRICQSNLTELKSICLSQALACLDLEISQDIIKS